MFEMKLMKMFGMVKEILEVLNRLKLIKRTAVFLQLNMPRNHKRSATPLVSFLEIVDGR